MHHGIRSARKPKAQAFVLVVAVAASCSGCHPIRSATRSAPPPAGGDESPPPAEPSEPDAARARPAPAAAEAGDSAPGAGEGSESLRDRGETPEDSGLPEPCRRARAELRLFIVGLPRDCEEAGDCEASFIGVPCEGTTVFSRGALEGERRARWEVLFRRARSECPPPEVVCGPPMRVDPECRDGRCVDPARPDAWP